MSVGGSELTLPRQMLGAHIGGGKNRNKLCRGRGAFYARTPAGIRALHQAHHARNLKSELTRRFDRGRRDFRRANDEDADAAHLLLE